ncbi:MAG: hypothetical protein ACP6IS_00510 [Candidatus Asgardarchaeia archaeon]
MKKTIKRITFALIILLCMVNIFALSHVQAINSAGNDIQKYGTYETSPDYGIFFEFNVTVKKEWIIGESTFVNISIKPISIVKNTAIEIVQLELIVLQLEKNEAFYYSVIPDEEVNSISLMANSIGDINKEFIVLPEFQGTLTFKIQIYFNLDSNASIKGESFSNFVGYVEVKQFPERVLEYNSTILVIFLLIIVLLFVNIIKNQYKENRGIMDLIIILLIAMILSAGIYYILTQGNYLSLVQEKTKVNKSLIVRGSDGFKGLILTVNTSAFRQRVDVNNFVSINITLAIFNFSLKQKILGVILLFKGQELLNSSYDILYSDFYLTENYTSITSEIIVKGAKIEQFSLELSTIILYLILPNKSILVSPQRSNFNITTIEFVGLWETPKGGNLAISLIIFLLTNIILDSIIIKKYFLQKKKREEFFV